MTAAAPAESFDFEAVFQAHYRRIARVIFRVIQDPSRADELAVDVFWKLWRRPSAHGPNCAGWLYRSALRLALDELRRRARREKYERWFTHRSFSGGGFGMSAPGNDPERAHADAEARTRIRAVLTAIRSSEAQLIVLRAEGLSYEELAEALKLKPTSVGTMLRRAHESFRKEYVKRYGDA